MTNNEDNKYVNGNIEVQGTGEVESKLNYIETKQQGHDINYIEAIQDEEDIKDITELMEANRIDDDEEGLGVYYEQISKFYIIEDTVNI